jgi:hypothetical protein
MEDLKKARDGVDCYSHYNSANPQNQEKQVVVMVLLLNMNGDGYDVVTFEFHASGLIPSC